MARTKTTPKILVVKKKEVKKRGGKRRAPTAETPWAAKGWTREEWVSWHEQRQPINSSSKATLNPSWWLGKGMKFKSGCRSLQEIRYFQKHTQLLIRKLPFSR
ncbi:MAG: hypothetical protein MPJ22_07585 [Pirellulales bacterium]|nr:hypothetical protein [Pirellulales bacterium]